MKERIIEEPKAVEDFIKQLNDNYLPFKDVILQNKEAVNHLYRQSNEIGQCPLRRLPEIVKLSHLEDIIDRMTDSSILNDSTIDRSIYYIEAFNVLNSLDEPIKSIVMNSLLNFEDNVRALELLNEIKADKSSQIPPQRLYSVLLGLKQYIIHNITKIPLVHEVTTNNIVYTPEVSDFPDELNTDKAKKMLECAIKKCLVSDKYEWVGDNKSLLAYFSEQASRYLSLGRGEYNGKPKISWKPFETLFGVEKLAQKRKDYTRYGGRPNNYKSIDDFFDQLC